MKELEKMNIKFECFFNICPSQKENFTNIVNINYENETILIDFVFNSFDAFLEFIKNRTLKLDVQLEVENAFKGNDSFDKMMNQVKSIENEINNNFDEFIIYLKENGLSLNFDKLGDFSFKNIPSDVNIEIDTTKLSLNEILELLSNSNIGNNCTFIDKYNVNKSLSYKEMLIMYQKISGIAKEIDSTNLSPLELIYIIYNKVRERIYTKEEENEDWKKSRNLFEVLNDKKIVCVGFANLFTALCDCFNIKSEIILWYPMDNYKRGHASNIVFVNDLKYNVNGAFTVDVTWDSKKNENDSSYISNIRSLFLSYRAECNYKKGYHLESPKSNTIDTINRKYYNYTNFLKLNVPANIIENPLKSLIDKINDFYKLIGVDEISYTIDELINKPILVRNIYNEWRNYFDNTLEDDIFLNLIESVRSIEISNEPKKANESTATAEEILNTNIEFITTKRRTEFFNELFSRTKEKPTN